MVVHNKDILNNEDKLLQVYLNRALIPKPIKIKKHLEYHSDFDIVTAKHSKTLNKG